MMNEKEIVQYCVSALVKAGVQKAQCVLQTAEKHELNVASDKLSLLRTTYDTHLELTGILDQKKGALSLNKLDQASLDQAVEDVVALAKASEADPAYDIAEQQPSKAFKSGPEAPELDLMYEKLTRFLDYCKTTYPNTIKEEVIFDFTIERNYFQNSNGVDFAAQQGHYNFDVMFTSKEGKNTSSSNESGFSTRELDKELHEFGSIDTLLKQSSEQTTTKMLPEKILGELIITPDCLGEFIEFITEYLHDYALISGTSIFKDRLQQSIADEKLTLHSRPVSEEIVDGYFFTQDGYEAQNSTIIAQGVLHTFLLSLYGSNKTKRPRAGNDGEAYIIEPGKTPLETMIRSISKGILLCRFSGGSPSENGDFSGVAKNSYYVEKGEIQYPLSETMISGNLATLLKNIRYISQERIDFGSAIFPWIQVSDVTISGK